MSLSVPLPRMRCTKPVRGAFPLALVALLLTAQPGCQAVFPLRGIAQVDEQGDAGEVASVENGHASDQALDHETAELARQLQSETWFEAVRPAAQEREAAGSTRSAFRWQHPGLEQLANRPPPRRPDLEALLSLDERTVRINAAIGLAREGNAAGVEVLVDAIRDVQLALPMRRAAAEALGGIASSADVVPQLGELIEEFGAFEAGAAGSYVAELHGEMLRSLARHVDAGDAPQMSAALRSPSPEVRQVALHAWAVSRHGELPEVVADLRYDQQAEVRAAALEALAARQHPQAVEIVQAALYDHALPVRLAAVVALGEVGGGEAREELIGLLSHDAELMRAAAVEALAKLGDQSNVLGAVGDESWRVREQVARELGRYCDREARSAAATLLADPSPQVQLRTVEALAAWPAETADPLLFEAIENASYVARRAAVGQLAQRYPPFRDFPVDAPPQRRQEALEPLRRETGQPFAPIDREALSAAHPLSPSSPAAFTPDRLREAAAMLDRFEGASDADAARGELTRYLEGLGAELVPVLEMLAVRQGRVLPEFVYRELLPRHAREFEMLERLRTLDEPERRRAALQLGEEDGAAPLGPLILQRLVAIVQLQRDPVIWRSVLVALHDDASEPVARLAYAGLTHPSVDVRVRSCEYLAAHPQAEHAAALLPALEDDNVLVVRAAVRALAHPGMLRDTSRLESLLTSQDKALRLDAARTLAIVGAESGRAAIERFAYDPDAKVRQQAAELMGELPDASYTGTLIGLLDGPSSLRRAALESLPAVVGRDVASEAPEESLTMNERAARWKRWWDEQARTTTHPSPTSR